MEIRRLGTRLETGQLWKMGTRSSPSTSSGIVPGRTRDEGEMLNETPTGSL